MSNPDSDTLCASELRPPRPVKPAATAALAKTLQRQEESAAEVSRASAAYKSGQYDVFARSLRRALELDPKNMVALQVLGDLNLNQGNLPAAATIFSRILEQDANDADATFGLGVCFFNQSNKNMARQSFERVLKLQPNHGLALEHLQALRLGEAANASLSTILVYNYNYDGCSAGVRALHYLSALLRAAHIPVAVTHRCFYDPTIPVRARALPEDIVIYPDASRGNTIGAERICRYMLYYASGYYGGDRIAKDECPIVFHRNYFADVQAHCDTVLTDDDIITIPILDKEWCFPEEKTIENVLYVGKGKGKALPKIDFMLVAPASAPQNHSAPYADHYAHMRTLAVLRKAKNFYTMDENTLMSCEAALCGCNVFFVKGPNEFEEQTSILDLANSQVMSPGRDIAVARRVAGRIYKFFEKRPVAQQAEKCLPAPPAMRSAEKPEVSIIIPTFNNIALTRDCLAALQKNTVPGQHEIIVVDNASTDETVEFLKGQEQTGRLRCVLNRENGGFSKACNQGAQTAKADLLLFLNNDTQVTPGWLDALSGAARRPQTGIAGAKLLYGDGRIQHAGIGFVGKLPDHPHRYAAADAPEVNQFRELDMVTGACLMIRRELFQQLAGFDEAYRNGVEDIDLCLRVRAAGWKVVYEPKAVVFHLEGQSAGRFNHVAENLEIFFNRWGKSFDGQNHFVAPKPAKTIAPKSSLLLNNHVSVAWEGTFLDFGSLSYVNRQVTTCLAGPGVELSLVGDRTLAGSAAGCSELQELARTLKPASEGQTQVTVRHQWPPNWSRPKSGALIVIQPWEFGALPKEWVKSAPNVDEFWVYSNYVRRVYTHSGIPANKVVVIPLGVDPAQFHAEVTPLKLATEKKFRFLFVGGTISRKGPDVLLKAYLEAFTAADDVCLVIKDFGGQSVYQGQTFEKEIAAARLRPSAPEILYLNTEMPPADMPRLYAACHCLVHPYRGEGFGLPVLEAMACGLPVVVTRGGATDDFVSAEAGWFISAQRKSIGPNIGAITLVSDGWWLEPEVADLVAKLKHIQTHPDEAKTRGNCGAEVARKNYTWDRVAEKMKARLREVSAKAKPQATAVNQTAKIQLPPAALAGHLGPAREALNRKQHRAAWELACETLKSRPFHPEAWLMLAEIALRAGDGDTARQCAQRARDMAPGWAPPKQFLKGKLRGNVRPEWLKIPAGNATPRITVCLIAKNEEKFLGQCLRSVRAIASQIIVVDTGSTDRTIEIAKEHGAEVHSFAWCDDFAAARNAALEHAAGDWILALDADEELMPNQAQILNRELLSPAILAYRIPILDAGREQEGCNYVPRLFRNAPGLFFVGRIHEQVSSSIQVRCQQWGLKHQIGESRLLHHGYTDEVLVSRNKVDRNLRLLNRAVEELPGEPNLVMSLGLELTRSGQLDAGIERYWQAFHLLAALPANQVTPELRETLLTQLTQHLMTAKRFFEVVLLWEIPFAKSGGMTASQHFSLGLAHIELKQPAEAAEQMRRCAALRNQPALTPINPEILKAAPNHCLALCLAALNQADAARQAFEAALADDPLSRPVRFDFARFQAAQGAHIEALKVLNQLNLENPAEARVWQFGGEIALSRPECLDFARHWTGQAIKHFPQNQAIVIQRAEALTLTQNIEEALPLWRQAHSQTSVRHRAAMILCELLAGDRQYQFRPEEEPALSREAVNWYRQWINSGAHSLLHRLHERIEQTRLALPSFVSIWEAADRQARKVAA